MVKGGQWQSENYLGPFHLILGHLYLIKVPTSINLFSGCQFGTIIDTFCIPENLMIQLAPIKPLFCTNKYTFLEIRQFLLILNQSHKIINNKKLFGVAGGTFYLYSYQISVFIVTYYWDD